ncbi:NAD-specific glutamate dehydrogenase [Pseudomonas donghuensis]
MHLAFDIADVGERAIVVIDAQVVIAVEHFPGTDLLVRGFDAVELAELVATGFTGDGVGQLTVVAVSLDVGERGAVGLDVTLDVFALNRERAHGPGRFQPPGLVGVIGTGRGVVAAAQGQAVAVGTGILAAVGADAAHAQAAADTAVERGVGEVALGIVDTQVQDVAGFVHRCEDAAQVELLGAVAVLVLVGGVLGEGTDRAIQRVTGVTRNLQAQAAVVGVGPVDQVVGSGTFLSGYPLGAGGFFQAELRVETTELDRYRAEAVVGQRGFIEVTVFGTVVTAGVVREVVSDLVGPVLVHHAAQFQVGAAEVTGVSGVAVVGVETVETAVVGLNPTAQLEAELFVGGSDLEATLGLDYDIGAVGGHGTRESLGGNGHGQGAGCETCEVLTDHRRSSPTLWS